MADAHIEVPTRYLLFLGNLAFDTTKEQIEEYFERVGDVVAVRLLTDRDTGKPRGCAFLELADSATCNRALKLHHTILNGRKINVELSAGGGGNSSARRKKIADKNKKLTEERRKSAARRKDGGDDGDGDGDDRGARQKNQSRPRKYGGGGGGNRKRAQVIKFDD